MRLSPRLLASLFLALALGGGWFAWRGSHPAPKPPFEVSFWVWQGPFALGDKEVGALNEMGVRQLFVRAGTFTSDGEHLSLMLPQRWQTCAKGLACHLVFNFDAGVVSHFGHYDMRSMSTEVRSRIEKQVNVAQQAGVDVAGVQFDFDVPTSKLARYAELLQKVREESVVLKPGGRLKVSATGLVTWLHSGSLLNVSRQLDFIAPQFYEGFTGRTLDRMSPISDLAGFRQNVHLADRLACPYYVGVPAYGHALLYDEIGRLQALYSGLPPAEALRHPSFKVESAYPCDLQGHPAKSPSESVDEEILTLRAIRPDRNGRGLDNTLAYAIPSPELLRRYLAAARDLQSDRCLGAIIYRYPEPGQSLALPMETVRSVLLDKPTAPRLRVAAKGHLDSYDMVERVQKTESAPMDVFLDVTNDGAAPTFVSPDSVQVRVKFDQTGFDDVRRRDMDSVTQLDGQTLEFRKGYIAPGQTLHVGPIRLLGQAKTAHIEWRVRTAEGFEDVTGVSESRLSEKSEGRDRP